MTPGRAAGKLPAAQWAQRWKVLLGHFPGVEAVALAAQLLTGLLEDAGQLLGIAVGAAGDFRAAQQARAGAVDDAQAELAVAILRGPGHALEGLEGAASDDQGFVDAKCCVDGAGRIDRCLPSWIWMAKPDQEVTAGRE